VQERGAGARPRWHRRALVIGVVVAATLLQRERIAELPEAATALLAARPGWIVVVAAASAISYVMAAFAMIGTVGPRVPFGAALLVQVATGAATLAAPAGLGSAGLNVWYLEREGLPRHEAVTAAVLNGLAGGAVHVVGMAVALVSLSHLVARPSVPSVVDGPLPVAVAALALVAVAIGTRVAVRRVPRATADLAASMRAGWSTARQLLRRGDRLAPLVGGSVGLTLANGLTLWASVQALGLPIDLPTAIAIELTVEALAGLSPTPGGAGVAEAAGIQGLILVGAPPATAIAVVLLHRAATTWLPALPGVLALRRLHATAREPLVGPHVAMPAQDELVVELAQRELVSA
jgi:glycosyltransferase 2 family protein